MIEGLELSSKKSFGLAKRFYLFTRIDVNILRERVSVSMSPPASLATNFAFSHGVLRP